MSDSLSDWLQLREGADWTSRSSRLAARITGALAPADPVHVLDLCTGTGSNLRYLIDRLPGRQRWLVVDRDASLLAEVPERLALWAGERGLTTVSDATGVHIRGSRLECDVEIRRMNVASLDAAIFEGRHLVTASALLDLASEGWITLLAERCGAVRASALLTLTYDGRSSCDPPEPDDEIVLGLFNRHQKTDKGLGGPAAGPDAWAAAVRSFTDAGYLVESASSDWVLKPAERTFQRQLIEGWARAAAEIAPERTALVDDWLRRRLAHVQAGRSRIIVGHQDIAAWGRTIRDDAR
jgi:hypothetical protein